MPILDPTTTTTDASKAGPHPFAGFDVRLDPWSVEYGAELPAASDDDAPSVEVEPFIEVARAEWGPVDVVPADASALPREVAFVDGVRRLELRVVVPRGLGWAHGAFGSWAVGCVLADGQARFGEHEIGRCLVIGSGVHPPAPVALGPGLFWRNDSTEGDDTDAPPTWVHRQMREAEERFGRKLALEPSRLVISDGPLSFVDRSPSPVLGLVKRLHQLYLPNDLLPHLFALTSGQRTPLIALQGTAFPRYTWFIRLSDPQVGDPPLSGIVRVEVAIGEGRDRARQLADQAAIMLPRYVPARSRDPRAPQNLLAIGALEAHLRRQLGDQQLLRRHLESLVRSASPKENP